MFIISHVMWNNYTLSCFGHFCFINFFTGWIFWWHCNIHVWNIYITKNNYVPWKIYVPHAQQYTTCTTIHHETPHTHICTTWTTIHTCLPPNTTMYQENFMYQEKFYVPHPPQWTTCTTMHHIHTYVLRGPEYIHVYHQTPLCTRKNLMYHIHHNEPHAPPNTTMHHIHTYVPRGPEYIHVYHKTPLGARKILCTTCTSKHHMHHIHIYVPHRPQ